MTRVSKVFQIWADFTNSEKEVECHAGWIDVA